MISKNKLKKTKIIATIGPASNSYEIIKKIILNGVNLCRINFSHTNHEDALNIIYLVKKINNEIGTRVAILGDLQGPKLRIGLVKKNTILKASSKIQLTNKSCVSSEKKIFVNYPRLIKDLNINDKVLIDDGKIKLRILTKNKSNITCEVINGGPISSKKGVNLPTSKLSLKSITQKDRKDLNFLIKNKIEWVALSFVQSAKDIIDLRKIINAKKSAIKIIAKIEKPQAIKSIKSITRSSDAVMIARGDLGIEIPMQKVPIFQKKIITLCLNYSKPVVVATQLMEGMINNPITTRAETNDVANAVFDGADALMLSGETAIGKNPIKVVKAMSKIILSVENSDFELKSKVLPPKKKSNSRYISDSICLYACKLADQTQAKAIITLTASGYNAQKICSNRPKSFIYVFTHNKQILNTLSLLRGVYTFYYTKFNSTDETIKDLHKFLIKWKFIKKGDTVINIGSMPVKEKGMTNMLKLNTVN